MVKLDLNKLLDSHVTNKDGDVIYKMINDSFKKGLKVEVSFEGIYGLNSSFVNSAFVQLLDNYPFDFVKKNLIFSKSNKQINNLILSRFKFETKKCPA